MTLTPRDMLVILTIAIGSLVSTSAMSSVNIATPLIGHDFGATLGEASWVLNGYLIVLAGFSVTVGRLADVRGLKRTFLEGAALFTGASLLCFLSVNLTTLIGARILQAAGAAMLVAVGPALVSATIPDRSRGTGQSWVAAASLTGAAAGIGAGGVISGLAGWRFLFLVMFLLGASAYLLGRALLSEVKVRPRTVPFDTSGAVILFCTLAALIAALTLDYNTAVPDTIPAVLYGCSLVSAAAFGLNLYRAKESVLNIALFRNQNFSAALASLFFMYLLFGGVTFFVPFILIHALNLSVVTAGLILMIAAAASILVSPVAGMLADRYGSRPVCIAAVLLTGCTCFGFTLVDRSYPVIMIGLILLFRIMLTFYAGPATKLVLDHCPPGQTGSGSGVLVTGRYTAYAVGIALFILVFEVAAYGAGLPNDGTAIVPRLTPVLDRAGYLAVFLFATALTALPLIFSSLARDREATAPGQVRSGEGPAEDAGF